MLLSNEYESQIDGLALEISVHYKVANSKPFPYDDCRKLREQLKETLEDFTSDLAEYHAGIAGFESSVKRWRRWEKERIELAHLVLKSPFYEKYLFYRQLEPVITNENSPRLCAEMSLNEEMRNKLNQLLGLINEFRLSKKQ